MQSWEPIDQKPSLHINIDKFVAGAAFFGLKDLTLNNMHSDFSMMHERMAYWIARKAGVPASRANHALVTVNGQPYGLYANVETVKKNILKRTFGNNTGALFTATDVDFVAADIPLFELVTGPDDRTMLSGLAAALTAPEPDRRDGGRGVLRRHRPVHALLGDVRGRRPARFVAVQQPRRRLLRLRQPRHGTAGVHALGHRRELLRRRHRRQHRSIRCSRCSARRRPPATASSSTTSGTSSRMAERLGWAAEQRRVAAQIAPYVMQDTRKWYTTDQVAMYQSDMGFFISDRRSRLMGWIPPASGAPPTGVMPQQP